MVQQHKKKSKAKTKDIMEMNNLRGINSTVDEAENQINDLKHKTNKSKKKKESKKQR